VKISGVNTKLVSIGDATHCVLELNADEDIVGVAIGPASIQHHAKTLVDEVLLNADPRAVAAHWQALSRANTQADGTLASTIAALDIALWDLKAKLNDEPLWRTLGGLRPRVNTHIRAPSFDDEAAFDAWCRQLNASSDVRGVVLTTSGDASEDAHRFTKIREALANPAYDCKLMLDANERWSAKDATRAISEIERNVDLAWVESPTARADFLGHKRVLDSIRGAVCAGGKLSSATDFLPHLHHHSLNIVQLDIARTGITAALQIADAAYAFELPIALTRSPGNIHAHLGAALPYAASMEVEQASNIDSDVRIENGWAVAGDRAGHGLALASR
jgi:L-alanine-DL-glutamate epimerase-like enolase superfamily enzyme